MVKNDSVSGVMKPNAALITHKWFPAGHILFYTARPLHKRVITIGSLEDMHKFAWLNKTQEGLKMGDDAYCIVPSNIPTNANQMYGAYFETISIPDTIAIISKKVHLRNFYVYKMKNCKKLPINPLP